MSELTTLLNESFDPSKEEGTPAFTPIPKGTYVAAISEAQVGALKSGKGQAVNAKWKIEAGPHAGRVIFDRIIVEHESAEAKKIGRRKLKDICDAVGWGERLTDLTVLHDKPCSVYVAIEEDKKGDYPPKNKIARVQPIAKPEKADNAESEFNDPIPF
jgi:hypothetical protein